MSTSKKITIALSMLFFFNGVNAQYFHNKYDSVVRTIKERFNAHQYDSIFYMFSPSLRSNFSIKNTSDLLSKVNAAEGGILSDSFEAYGGGKMTYILTFAKSYGYLDVAVDSLQRFSLFAIYKSKDGCINPSPHNNLTEMDLPFKEEWSVMWGGGSLELNRHFNVPSQKYAFDIVMCKEGKTYKNTGKNNSDYYAYGQELLAPCDGEVVMVKDEVPDNNPGQTNILAGPGNSVILKTKFNEYVYLAHLIPHSIKVKKGQIVKQGELLGLCGNSGNSTEPHLHFHIQDRLESFNAKGISCFFSHIIVNDSVKFIYSPIRGDRVRCAEK